MVDKMAASECGCSNYCPGMVRHTGKWLKNTPGVCDLCRELFVNPSTIPDESTNPCPCFTWDDFEDLYRHVKKVAGENNA